MKIKFTNPICPVNLYFVKLELETLGIPYHSLEMGMVDVSNNTPDVKLNLFKKALLSHGLEMEYDENITVLRIKLAIKEYLNDPVMEIKTTLSKFLSQRMGQKFEKLNEIFLRELNLNIPDYYVSCKVNRAIKLLKNYNLTQAELAFQLNFGSENEFVDQFKKMTGITPNRFKQLMVKNKVGVST